MFTIYELKLEVCSPCQNDCELCAHADLMRHIKGYQLSLENLDRFLYYTERSNYFLRSVAVHGPGEPFLWKHLNEGLQMLGRSKAVGWISSVTNGQLLDRITDETMESIDRLFVSVYENYNRYELLEDMLRRYPSKMKINDGKFFWEHAASPTETAPIPARCSCSGPMLFDDKIFPYCGPPVFGAAKAKGVDVYDLPNMWVPIGMNYMEKFNAKRVGSMDICRHCWANENFQGRLKLNDTRKKLAGTPENPPTVEELLKTKETSLA